MGKILVLYHSASGNTAKMAALVGQGAESIPGIEVRLRDVESATAGDVHWCDGPAVGSPTNMGIRFASPRLGWGPIDRFTHRENSNPTPIHESLWMQN
jgi:NAD(P)H dehydrogenase (quinone)